MRRNPIALLALTVGLYFAFLTFAANVAGAATSVQSEDTLIATKDVQTYYRVQEQMDPSVGNLFQKLVQRFGDRENYTAAQVQWPFGLKDSKIDQSYEHPVRPDKVPPPGAYSAAVTNTVLTVHAERTGKSVSDYKKGILRKFGPQPWYMASEIRDIEATGNQNAKIQEPAPRAEITEGWQPIVDGFRNFKIRQSWSDVMSTEDPSVEDAAKGKLTDLVGATFSFAKDYEQESDTWNADGALIFPMVWRNIDEPGLVPVNLMLAPSVSIDRVSTTGTSVSEVDELYFRIGMSAKWLGPRGWLDTIQLRAAPVYGTDTGFRARLPAYELELEPTITWQGIDLTLLKYFELGYDNVLLGRKADQVNGNDDSLLDYQFRAWLHAEGGDLQRDGATWHAVEGSFFRIGPEVQLRINFPRVWNGFSITALYSYLSTMSGPEGHNQYFKLDGTLALYSNPVLNEKISLNADYTVGGLDFTKENVNTFTIGLSALF